MTKHMLPLIVLSSALVSGPVQQAKTPRFRTALKVSGDSEIASTVEGCLKQALDSLGDVDLSEAKPDYTINVIALEVYNKEKTPMGIALTWLTLYHPKGFFEDCSLMEDYRLLTVEQEDLQSSCQKLVERFNTKSLEPHRKLFQKEKP
ncbi:MAG TPA: hypothetical protein VE398_08125 [Acidobacteriota bacterium]|nr:hypothetical protein [Acidobacteriota bacterium]